MTFQPMGAEENAFWLLDSKNMEVAYGGLNATARDYAKLGELYRLKGRLNGKQIIPSEWVDASIKPDAPHLMPGENSHRRIDSWPRFSVWVFRRINLIKFNVRSNPKSQFRTIWPNNFRSVYIRPIII